MTEEKYPLDYERRFAGVSRLYTPEGADRLRRAHVAVVGLGGVGSWAAEALARTAVGHITLIDLDNIAESNTNRQLQALSGAYGKPKAQALEERIGLINPICEVSVVEDFVDAENVGELLLGADAVLDCIDQVKAKAAIAAFCRTHSSYCVSCGAAGGKKSATQILTEDLALTQGDPLLSKVRYELRRRYGFPKQGGSGKVRKFGIMTVYTKEPVLRPQGECAMTSGLSCTGYGSAVVVTAAFGFAAASLAINTIAGK